MEPYIQISKINDFTFCPATLYLHSMYEGFNQETYHETPQVVGKLNHETVDAGTYSTAKKFMAGTEVYSGEYNIMGKIDIYDKEAQTLIERKTRIKKIYDGYRYQLYAQYYCLTEMGHPVKKLILRSLEDNKSYEVPVPSENDRKEFESILSAMRNFDPKTLLSHRCPKCAMSIYGTLGW